MTMRRDSYVEEGLCGGAEHRACRGCGRMRRTKSEGPDYADDEAMSVIAEGFDNRSNLIDSLEGEGKDTTESANLKQVIQIEIDNDKDLKARPFKNSNAGGCHLLHQSAERSARHHEEVFEHEFRIHQAMDGNLR
ncbi:hypothetical protein AAAU71_06440 [Bifidobacterium pseudocatenulatum]|uniref:hypothetical protein n=1 Tax=Bifidobacterium pseudocatenulatum TaxID=28026 RepID=UPI0032C1E1EF|nr:hypothetical protein [Bifidobacterium pseudocatenulatum]